MASNAAVTFSCRNFADNGLPSKADVAFRTTFRKRLDDALVSVSFTDETLRTPGACPGLILSAEKVVAPGLKVALRHDAGSSNTNVSLCVAKRMGGQDVQLKMSYIHNDRALVLEEAWHVDKATRLSGSFNFATQESRVSASRDFGALTASAGYAFSTEAPTIGLSHRRANRTLGVVYAVKDDEAAVQWACAPFTLAIKAKGTAKRRLCNVAASLSILHEFDF